MKLLCSCLLKEIPTQVFSCEYCEVFKNSFCYNPPVAAFELILLYNMNDYELIAFSSCAMLQARVSAITNCS